MKHIAHTYADRKIHIKAVAFGGANPDVFKTAKQTIEKLIPQDVFVFTDKHPDVIFFVTGGSEMSAIDACSKLSHVVLWSSEEENAHASATEVTAWLNAEDKKSLHWDINDESFFENVMGLYHVLRGSEMLNNQQLGLLGSVSEWLVASDVLSQDIKNRFGVDLVPVTWDALPSYKECGRSEVFDKQFKTADNVKLIEASKVHTLIQKTIDDNHLDAITVECFPLVKEHKVTACLSLSLLNDLKIPAGCEGDLTAIVGMMFANAVLGEIPWMANTIKVSRQTAKFAHCTVPVSHLNSFTIPTHYETNEGTAIQGDIKAETLTIFRFDAKLEKMFISLARVIDRPKSANACRTQIEVTMPEDDLKKLKINPLGNHHLFLEGDFRSTLTLAAKWFSIEVL